MMLEPIRYLLGALSGGLVGFVLGLVGGGGSILDDAHVAIGTSALAVAANTTSGLASHWRAGNVKWCCGFGGILVGSSVAKRVSEQTGALGVVFSIFIFAVAL